MDAAHHHITNYLGGGTFTPGIAYVNSRGADGTYRFHKPLMKMRLPKGAVKQLWISHLNMGGVQGWLREVRKNISAADNDTVGDEEASKGASPARRQNCGADLAVGAVENSLWQFLALQRQCEAEGEDETQRVERSDVHNGG